VTLTAELVEYFSQLRIKHGIVLDANQRAWYAKMSAEQGPDDMKSDLLHRRGVLLLTRGLLFQARDEQGARR
jgi:hypothetical protein